MLFSALKLKLVFNRKEQSSACMLSKLMLTSRKWCYSVRCGKSRAIKGQITFLCLFGLVHRLHPFSWFWRIQTKLFYLQWLVCTDPRICYFCDSCYRNLNLQRYTSSKISCTMHLQYYSLRLQLTHSFYNKKTLLKTTTASGSKMFLLLTLKKSKWRDAGNSGFLGSSIRSLEKYYTDNKLLAHKQQVIST